VSTVAARGERRLDTATEPSCGEHQVRLGARADRYIRVMDTGLRGARVLVTGGAGGIGAAIVRRFAAEGAHTAIHAHTSVDAAQQLAIEVGGTVVLADLTVEDQADALVPSVVNALGGLDVCVANAGRWPPEATPVWELTFERWQRVLAANLATAFLTTRGFLRHVATTGTGALVLVGSTAGTFGEAGHADYAAAKGAIMSGLLRSVKNEVAGLGPEVRVNAVAPGWTVTPQRAAAGIDPDHVERATATMALKKLATPDDIAAVVVMLASPLLSGHITGEVVTVAGGMEGRLQT
jgi:3-oxoacyl-[acyl-carrier protein] reductase